MAELGSNTVRVYHDFGTGPDAEAILDEFYRHGIKVVMQVDSPRHGVVADLQNLAAVVSEFRNHPAILMWSVGNEWDLNFGSGYYYGAFPTLPAAADFVEAAAQLVKSIDPDHPVITFMADPHIPGVHPLSREAFPHLPGPAYTSDIVNSWVPSIDVWGFNVYRGASFGDVFQMWASISEEPMLIGEFGADSYDHRVGAENEAMQAEFTAGLWDELHFNLAADRVGGVAAGGLVFSFRDEYWKNGDPSRRAPSSEHNGGQPDGYNDEEYFGVLTADQQPKEAYWALRNRFHGGSSAVVLDPTPVLRASSQGSEVNNAGASFSLSGKTVFQRTGGAFGGRGISIAVLDVATGIRMSEVRNFDTWYSPAGFGSSHVNFPPLVAYLNSLPEGTTVIMAIGDDGGFIHPPSGNPWADPLVEQGYQAIESLGSTQIRQVPYNGGWAMIAVKGQGVLAEARSAAFTPAVVEVPVSLTLDPAANRRPPLGVLTIAGTEAGDVIEIGSSARSLTASVNGVVSEHPFADLGSIVIDAMSGDDVLRVHGRLPLTPLFRAGEGVNVIELEGSEQSFFDVFEHFAGGSVSVLVRDAVVSFDSRQDLRLLRLAGTATVRITRPGTVLKLTSLEIENGAVLDIGQGGLVVEPGPADPDEVHMSLVQQVRLGHNGGNWFGTGITSSYVAANASGGITVGVTPNWIGGRRLFNQFMGEPASEHATFVAPTLSGDADLNGNMDPDDYWRIDRGFLHRSVSFSAGDFNYDGRVDLDDYVIIDQAFLAQTSPQYASVSHSGEEGMSNENERQASWVNIPLIVDQSTMLIEQEGEFAIGVNKIKRDTVISGPASVFS